MSKLIIITVLLCPLMYRTDARTPGPGRLPWYWWVRELASHHLINMTEELVKDAMQKLKQADKIKREHAEHSITYELGSVAAGIQERFHRMLVTYRKYANMDAFKNNPYYMYDYFSAFTHIRPSTPLLRCMEAPDMRPLMGEMTTSLITELSNETKDYKPTSVEEIMRSARRQLRDSLDQHQYNQYDNKKRACYSTHITYRSALWDLKRYSQIRWLYVDHLEYEVGYLTHEIIHRYQTVLELYQMVERRFIPHQTQHYATSSYMLYIYINILEQCKAIMHLCNMLREVKQKYKKHKKKKIGVFDDYDSGENEKMKYMKFMQGDANDSKAYFNRDKVALEKWLKEKKRRQRERAREQKRHRQQMMKYGKWTPRQRTSPKTYKRWDVTYGWSIESWLENDDWG